MQFVRLGQCLGIGGPFGNIRLSQAGRQQVRLVVGSLQAVDIVPVPDLRVLGDGNRRALQKRNDEHHHRRDARHQGNSRRQPPPAAKGLCTRLTGEHGAVPKLRYQVGSLSLKQFLAVQRPGFIQHHHRQNETVREDLHLESQAEATDAVEQRVQEQDREITVEDTALAAGHQRAADDHRREDGHKRAGAQHGRGRHGTLAGGEKRTARRRRKSAQDEAGHKIPVPVQSGQPRRLRVTPDQKEITAGPRLREKHGEHGDQQQRDERHGWQQRQHRPVQPVGQPKIVYRTGAAFAVQVGQPHDDGHRAEGHKKRIDPGLYHEQAVDQAHHPPRGQRHKDGTHPAQLRLQANDQHAGKHDHRANGQVQLTENKDEGESYGHHGIEAGAFQDGGDVVDGEKVGRKKSEKQKKKHQHGKRAVFIKQAN